MFFNNLSIQNIRYSKKKNVHRSPKQLVDAGIPYVILGKFNPIQEEKRTYDSSFLGTYDQVIPNVVHSSMKLQNW